MQHMVRILLAVTVIGSFVAKPATAQDTGFLPELEPYTLPFLAEAHPLPAESVPAYVPPRLFLDAPDLAPLDTLDEKSRLRRMANLYRYQGELLEAQAREDHEVVEGLFDRMMTEIAVIARAPDALDDPRFKELYRSVVTEFEAYYGFPDTLHIQQGDIFAWRDQAFEALNVSDLPPLTTATLPEVEFAADTDIPMQINEQVRNSMVYLLTEPHRHINQWLSRAETYFPMIEKILEEEGVPDELKYLAMIESGLNPKARSWARAVGMWQFVKATGYAYDLTANGWVDERMDPEKATRAAARHLKDLHRMFGDWQLALAGYNYSPGKLRRHLRQTEANLDRKATFWDVYHLLPRETRNYVPMFIATALLASNPEAYGLDKGVEPGPSYQFDLVPVAGALSLEEIAEMAGTEVATIKALNPELLGQTLPPSQSPYFLRLPLYSYDNFATSYRQLPTASRSAASQHVVRQGETIGQIARRYGVNVSTLMRKNGLHSTNIRVGQTLVVPATDYSDGLQVGDARPMRVQYGMRSVRIIMPRIIEPLEVDQLIAQTTEQARVARTALMSEAEAAEEARQQAGPADAGNEPAKPPARIVYRVRRGDTLIGIAKQYSVTVTQLRSWNNIRSNLLQIGQRLTIYPPSQP